MTLSFHTLPVEMIFQILDHLSDEQLFLSLSNVCQRLNVILNSYRRYQVNSVTCDKNSYTHITFYHESTTLYATF